MSDVMIFTEAEWPHGVRCSRCEQPFTEGQVMAETPDSFIGGALVTTVSHADCEHQEGESCGKRVDIARQALSPDSQEKRSE